MKIIADNLVLLKAAVLSGTLIIAINSDISAQNEKIYLKGAKKREIAADLVTAQYGDSIKILNGKKQIAAEKTKNNITRYATPNTIVNARITYRIIGDDKYLKAMDEGKRYDEFQVFDIKGMKMKDVMQGLLTNTLDRENRYTEKGSVTQKVNAPNEFVSRVDEKEKAVTAGEKVNISALRFRDKIFVILGENDYRYLDGKKLEGDKKLVDELLKGKPITETTFYFELEKADIIDNRITRTQFSKMSIAQQQNLLNGGSFAAN